MTSLFKKSYQAFGSVLNRIRKRILKLGYLFHKTKKTKFRNIEVQIRTQSPHEYIRASGAYEDFVLGEILDAELPPADLNYFEVGACNGINSILMGKYLKDSGGQVVCFEPDSLNCEAILSNIHLNQLHNVILVPLAISNHCGTAAFHYDTTTRVPGSGGHSLSIDFQKGSQLVPVINLDRAIQDFNLPSPTCISLDVEGHEAEVLEGMKETLASQKTKLVIVELDRVTDPNTSPILQRLKEFGFSLKNFKPSDRWSRPHCLASFSR